MREPLTGGATMIQLTIDMPEGALAALHQDPQEGLSSHRCLIWVLRECRRGGATEYHRCPLPHTVGLNSTASVHALQPSRAMSSLTDNITSHMLSQTPSSCMQPACERSMDTTTSRVARDRHHTVASRRVSLTTPH